MSAQDLTLRSGKFSIRVRPAAVAVNLLLLGTLAALILTAFCLGARSIPVATILGWLLRHDMDPTQSLILTELRAPRICLAVLCGAALALAGALTQQITRNGLADPSLIGVREGAALCIVALLLLWPGAPLTLRPAVGLGGGLAVGILISILTRGASPLKFVMIGIGISWCLSSLLVIFLASADISSLQRVMLWLAGSVEAADWPAVQLAAAILGLAGIAVLGVARHAQLDDMGQAASIALGVSQVRVRAICLVAAVFLVAGAVSVAGGLGFVGLIAPHIARFLPRQGFRGRLISSAIIGALLVLAADTLGRTVFAPVTLPAGIMLAAVGAPVLILLLWLRRKKV
jgi:iron complex transport system permease protein